MPVPPHTLSAIRQPALLYQTDGRVAAANDLAEALAGRSLAGLSAPEVVRVFRYRRPDGSPLDAAELPACRALAGEEVVDEPLAVTVADGRTLDLLVTATPFREDGAVAGALVLWQDVTERKRAEQALLDSDRRHAFLLALGDRLRELSTVSEITTAATEMVGRHLGVSGAVYCEIDGDGACASARAGWTDGTVPDAAGGYRTDDFGVDGLVCRTDGGAEGFCVPGAQASLGIPICRSGQLAAVLAVHSARPRAWTDAEVELVREAGDRIWTAVERARAEEALRQSEERLRDILKISLDAIYRRDFVADRFDYLSPINEALTGFSAEEFAALGLEEFMDRIHPHDRAGAEAVIAEAMRGGDGTFEYRFRCRDGSYRWFSDHFAFQLDADGRPHYRVGVIRDVTRRRETEAELRDSEARLRLALEGARIGIWDRDAATDRVTITPEFLGRYGLEAETFASYADWVRFIHPDDRARFAAERQAALAKGGPLDLEFRVVIPSGEVRWIQFKGQCMANARGIPGRVIGVLIDVTDRKRAEEALAESEADARSFLENMIDACAICETVFNERGEPVDIRLVDVNPAFARALSLPADLVVGRTAFSVIPEMDRFWFDRFLEVSRNRSFLEVKEPFPALGRWYHITAFPVRRGRVAVVFRDITERREAEAERARFTEDLKRSNEELQRFAYVASHDLQEPLRSIVSFSQLLERRYRGKLDQDADDYIAFIVEGGNRMQRLIEDLLQLSRIETKAKPFARTDAGEVVEGVLHTMETPIREAGATVTIEPLPTVMADAAQLAQVFTNLLGNALKYRRPGVPPVVRISAEREDRFWRFAIADNGIGIEAVYFDRIFVIFQRLHTREAYEGTGIGLAVVRKIIERHGGRIWLESTPGEGSTFFFTLPAA